MFENIGFMVWEQARAHGFNAKNISQNMTILFAPNQTVMFWLISRAGVGGLNYNFVRWNCVPYVIRVYYSPQLDSNRDLKRIKFLAGPQHSHPKMGFNLKICLKMIKLKSGSENIFLYKFFKTLCIFRANKGCNLVWHPGLNSF